MSEKINKNFKGLYDTSKTTFITDRTEPTNFYEPEAKTPRIKNVSYSINFDKKELYKAIKDLQQKVEQQEKEIDRLNNIIKELSKDVDMWNKKYNEKFDIINELEKYIIGETELNNGALLCGLSSDTEKDQYGIENNIYDNILDKLKELKETNNV